MATPDARLNDTTAHARAPRDFPTRPGSRRWARRTNQPLPGPTCGALSRAACREGRAVASPAWHLHCYHTSPRTLRGTPEACGSRTYGRGAVDASQTPPAKRGGHSISGRLSANFPADLPATTGDLRRQASGASRAESVRELYSNGYGLHSLLTIRELRGAGRYVQETTRGRGRLPDILQGCRAVCLGGRLQYQTYSMGAGRCV